MNWSQKLMLVRLGAFAALVLSIILVVVAANADNGVLGGIAVILGLVSLFVLIAAKFVARIIFHWHKAGSVGEGTRVWHD